MRKVLASIGIGSASVDTVLPTETVRPGESVDATVRIAGGDAEQEVGDVAFELETRYATEDGYAEATVDRFRLAESLTLEPDVEESRDVTLEVPYGTPVTMGRTDVWVETELEIDWAVDPEDTDYLDVRPTERMDAVFDAADDLGLSFRDADCEADPYGRYVSGRPFVQEFEFRPAGGPFAGDLDELELVFAPSPESLTVYAEIDRRGGLLSELADADERHATFSVADPTADVRDELRRTIEERL